jgi:hypothetical protein
VRKGKRSNSSRRTWSDGKFMADFACSDVGIDRKSCVATHRSSKRKDKKWQKETERRWVTGNNEQC